MRESMKKKSILLWIDDNVSSRKNFSASIAKNLGFEREFINVKGLDANKVLETFYRHKAINPDLIITDHFFTEGAQAFNHIKTGAGWVITLQDLWNGVPIVGVSAAKKADNVPHSQEEIYTLFLEAGVVKENIEKLKTLVDGFQKLNALKIFNRDRLVLLMKAPLQDKNILLKIIPQNVEAKGHPQCQDIYQWMDNSLFGQAGPLYDSLWASATLGLKESSFLKQRGLFAKAEYKGLFSNQEQPRWWKSELLRIAYSKVSELPHSTGMLGEKLPRISSEDLVHCSVCRKRYPEVVAFEDAMMKTRWPVHRHCCSQLVTHTELFFEPFYLADEE